MAKADPFYIIRGEVTDSLNDVQAKVSRFHGLMSTNPERKRVAKQVEKECDSIAWQLNELTSAVDVAAENPARFNLTSEELNSRRRWIETTQKQVRSIKDDMRRASEAPAGPPPQSSRYQAANDRFVGEEHEKQQLLLKKQDDALDEIEQHVNRIGRLGRTLGEELQTQERLLYDLNHDMDTTHTRLKATQRRMQELIRKTGSNTQLCVIVFLIVVLIILLVFALG